MKAIITSLLKSFWLSKIKFLLCIMAGVLSAWGISTIVYGYMMTNRDFVENFVRSNPADIILTINSPAEPLIEKIRAHEKVLQIERREVVVARIRNRNGNWMFIQLFGAPDPASTVVSKFDVIEKRSGERRSVFIEKNGYGFLNEALDTVAIQFSDNPPTSFKLAGLVHDPGQAPSQMEQALYGYTSIENIEPFLKPGQQRFVLKMKQKGLDKIELTLIGQELQSIAQESGIDASFVVPPPGEHPHQGIVDGIAFLQESFGTILSVLGAILLSLILITWLYPQIPSIGVMKALGASTKMIFAGYSLVLILIIGIGLVFGITLGYRSAKFYSGSIAFIQNFTPVSEPLPFIDHLVTIVPVILIPYLFTLSPLLRASGTSVQNALTNVFHTPFRPVFNLTQASLSNTKFKYSINNLFRNNQRTALLVVLLIAGTALFTTGSNLQYSLKKDFAGYAGDAGYPITVYLKERMDKPVDYIGELPFVERTSYVRVMSTRFQLPGQSKEEGATMRVYEAGYEFDPGRIIDGEWKANCPNCLYANQRQQEDFRNIKLGSELQVRFQDNSQHTFIYSGIVKDIAHPGLYVFTDSANVDYNEIAIKLKNNYPAADAARELDDLFLEKGLDVRQIGDLNSRLLALENHLAPMYLVIQVMGIVTMLVAMTGLIIVLNLSMQERAREMGIMKSLGGSVQSIVNMYQREYLVVTTISLIAGLIFGNIFNAVICDLFGVMVLNVPVPPLNDVIYLVIGAAGVLMIQVTVVSVYVRVKITQTSRQLVNDVY